MSPIVLAFLFLNALALLLLPRRWAPLPLIVGACYVTRAQAIDVQAFTFTVMQVLIVVGIARVIVRGEWRQPELNGLDYLTLLWGTWMALSVLFHRDVSEQIVKRLGLVFDGWGLYFLFRVFCRSRQEIARLCGLVAILLGPIAAAMLIEKATAYNVFSVLGGIPEAPRMRGGELRAQGPFNVPILAGNIGAVTLPLMVGLWQWRKSVSALGMAACVAMIYACSSSGPIVSAVAGIVAIACWPLRFHMRRVRWAAVLIYLTLQVVMKAPPYYLIARVDLTGSSTGWHRARLIESAFAHLSEWWLVGTDFTRHWMPTGITWSADHADLTNHYIRMGVLGGLPLMLIFIAWCTGKGVCSYRPRPPGGAGKGYRSGRRPEASISAVGLWMLAVCPRCHLYLRVVCRSVRHLSLLDARRGRMRVDGRYAPPGGTWPVSVASPCRPTISSGTTGWSCCERETIDGKIPSVTAQ